MRIVPATHRDLRKMVAKGQFREDLFYRLSVVEISLPTLAERKEDLLLQRHCVEKYAAIYKKDIAGLTRRSAPGGPWLAGERTGADLQDLPESLQASAQMDDFAQNEFVSLETMQERYLLGVLSHVRGNKAKAAEILVLAAILSIRCCAGSASPGPRLSPKKSRPETTDRAAPYLSHAGKRFAPVLKPSSLLRIQNKTTVLDRGQALWRIMSRRSEKCLSPVAALAACTWGT